MILYVSQELVTNIIHCLSLGHIDVHNKICQFKESGKCLLVVGITGKVGD